MSGFASSVSVVSVRGLVPGDASVVYVGRACAGWHASALGNPFRLLPGELPGAASGRFRVWLWESVVRPGQAGVALSGAEAAAWSALCGLVAVVRAGGSVRLACWCGGAASCHAWVVRAAVLFLLGG